MNTVLGEVRRRHVEQTLAELIDRRDILETLVDTLIEEKTYYSDVLSELHRVEMSIAAMRRELRSGL